jgi:8-oxo-dGTP pyrophosphatase MutT (NUDIX family)
MVKREFSCGGILYKKNDDSVQVVLVKRLRKNGQAVWCIPKGKAEDGETVFETALREVREETGMYGAIKEDLGKIGYWFHDKENGVKINKTVRFFLMEYISGNSEDHDNEVEEVRWFSLDQALSSMSYDSEKDILKRSKDILLSSKGDYR